jgi:hypothetical protein
LYYFLPTRAEGHRKLENIKYMYTQNYSIEQVVEMNCKPDVISWMMDLLLQIFYVGRTVLLDPWN